MTRLFVPGRLCLFGEHSDWAAGYRTSHPQLSPGHCLVAGTDQGLHAEVERRPEVVEITSRTADGQEFGPWCVRLEEKALQAASREGGFFSYAAGVAAEVLGEYEVEGIRLSVQADLPLRKGLSSSAAICVLMARAFGQLYELGLRVEDEMDLAYRGERLTGSVCGRMDQVCAHGQRPTFLCFDGDGLAVDPLDPGGEILLLVVDLRRGKDTRRILADLNRCFPDAPGEVARGVREALGPRNESLLASARHAVVEGDGALLGTLMDEAQQVFDRLVAPACPELAAPRLHEVLAHPAVREFGWGGKGVGSQGDGCAQIVARDEDSRRELAARLGKDLEVACLPLTLRPQAEESSGRGVVRGASRRE